MRRGKASPKTSKQVGQVTVHKSLATVFPDILRVDLRTQMNISSIATLSGNASYYLGFKAGSVVSIGPASSNTMPTSGSVFAANYPTGLQYLVGSTAGSSAPYGSYRVLRSSIKAMITPANTNSQGNTHIVLFPTNDFYSYSTLSFQTLMEQPFAKKAFLGNWASSKSLITLSDSLTPERVFGLTSESLVRTAPFTNTYNADAANSWWWYLCMQNVSGAGGTAQALDAEVTIITTVEFFDRNAQQSNPPS